MTEQQKVAEQLKNEAMEVAAALETIAYETDETQVKKAKQVLRSYCDGYGRIQLGTASKLMEVMQ